MNQPIRFALIGCGRITQKHVDAISHANKIGKTCRISAVCDIQASKAEHFSKKLGAPAFASPEEMLQRVGSDIDTVCVLTPSGLHAEHAILAAKYKKHVVVEKPMALRLEDADQMIESCDRANVRLFVVKQNRYNIAVQRLRGALESGRFGKLVMGTVRVRWCRKQEYYDQDAWRGTWALDGGVFTNQASHHIDLLQWMMGDVNTVYATARTSLVNIQTEDTGVAVLQFKNGALGVIEATTATRPKDLEGSLSILGEYGSVEIAGFSVNAIRHWNFNKETAEDLASSQEIETPDSVYGFGHNSYYLNVIDSIRSTGSALVDGLEGRRSLELINAIYESVESNGPVDLRFRPQKCRLGIRT